ncbi:O-antigen polymerase [Mariprofundus ferrinatatus]|uniref:O-antigen polymerase n=1 Tax=Mariprofundus ferrinatatus TaxID=1921087 RepID=UPI0012FF37A2|nr:O-antigen polymerase [Mariprofundus ferrinatatus]
MGLSMHRGRIHPFSPPFVLFFLVLVGCVLRLPYYLYEQPPYFLYGSLALFLGMLGFLIGYLIPQNYHIATRNIWKTMCFPRSKFFYFLTIIGGFTLFILFFQKTGVIGARFLLTEEGSRTSYAYLAWGGDILFVAFLLKVAQVRQFKCVGYLHWLMLTAALICSAMLGARLSILLYILAAFMVRRLVSGCKLPIVTLFVGALIVVGGLGVLRSLAQGVEDSKSVWGTALEHIMTKPYMLSMDKLSLIVGTIAERGEYWYGSTYISTLVMPIPRTLWNDKPSVESRMFVSQQVYKLNNLSGVPPGLLGELFLNFSWFGIILGMFIFGLASRLAWNTWRASLGDPLLAVFYTVFFLSLIILIGVDFLGATVFFLKLFIPTILLGRYYLRKKGGLILSPANQAGPVSFG